MENKISLLVALKNNLDYNKHFYTTTRAIYPEVEICFSSFNSTDGTDEWLDTLKDDPYTKVFHTTEIGNFSDNFNKAASLATKDYISFLHNDIVVAPGFIENLEKHCNPNTVVSYTTIEPPIFAGHERPGKIIYDLGVELETFDINKFYEFAAQATEQYKDQTEPGIVFFMCMPRDKYLEIGGKSEIFNLGNGKGYSVKEIVSEVETAKTAKQIQKNMLLLITSYLKHLDSQMNMLLKQLKSNITQIVISLENGVIKILKQNMILDTL